MMYTFRNRCEEKPEISYDDGLRFIYFNTKGRKGGSQSIRNVLNYVQNSHSEEAVDEATKELDRCVNNIRMDPERRGNYMTVGDLMDRKWNQGRVKGNTEGREQLLVELVCKKLSRGDDPETIVYDLASDVAIISSICTAAAPFAPDYDPEKVWESMHKPALNQET